MFNWKDIKNKIKGFLARRFGTPSMRSNAYVQQGTEFESQGRYDEAQLAFERAMVLNNSNPYAYYNLGVIYERKEDMVNAEKCYRRTLDLDNNFSRAAFNLGMMAMKNFRIDIAEQFLRIAMRAEPNNIDCLIHLHELNLAKGDFPAASDMIGRARAIAPEDVTLIQAQCGLLLRMGQTDKAMEMVEPFLEMRPVPPPIVYAFAELGKAVGQQSRAISLVEEVLDENSGLVDDFRRALYYQLGSLKESIKDNDGAFEAYAAGAALFNKGYQREAFERNIAEIVETTRRDKLQALARASYETEMPVFIVGTPRSGTTLAETILKAHPSVFGAGELPDVANMAYQLHRPGHTTAYPGLKEATPERLNEFALAYVAEIERRAGYTPMRSIDKMPGNFLQLAFIDRVFPGARIIHMKRDPLDACLSMFIQNFSSGHYYSFGLEDLAHYYKWYQKVADHCFSQLNVPVMEVSYEEMVSRPEKIIPQMLEFIGVPFDERCLSPEKYAGNVVTASHEQVRSPISPKSIGKWKRYCTQLEALVRALGTEEDIEFLESEKKRRESEKSAALLA